MRFAPSVRRAATPSRAASRLLRRIALLAVVAVAAAIAPRAIAAQDAQQDTTTMSAADSAKVRLYRSIAWEKGPTDAKLGDEATLSVPAGCRFTAADGAKKFMEVTENPPDGSETGVIFCRDPADTASSFFVVFSWDASGYVKDTEGKSLDADKILKSLQEGNDQANDERRSRGWETVDIVGWDRAPFYDPATNNLTWATIAQTPAGQRSINHSVRLLGRGGVMRVDLVMDPEQKASALPLFSSVIASHRFVPGHRYSEWRPGDKVAEYGLTALIAGGAGAAALKLGLFGKLWKLIVAAFAALWKLIAIAVAAVSTRLKAIFRRKPKAAPEPPSTPEPPTPEPGVS